MAERDRGMGPKGGRPDPGSGKGVDGPGPDQKEAGRMAGRGRDMEPKHGGADPVGTAGNPDGSRPARQEASAAREAWTFRDVVLGLDAGVLVTDPEFRVLFANPRLQELTGASPERSLGRPCWEVLRSSLCQRDCPVREVLETGEPARSRRGFLVNVEGGLVPVRVSASPLYDGSGRLVAVSETIQELPEARVGAGASEGGMRLGRLVSRSPAMARVFDLIRAAARTKSTVLIQGETGTGKELVARAIHELGPGKDEPFVAVSCAAVPAELVESELFGHVRGAFTGADRDRRGRFDAAGRGTLFLDEVGELPESVQVKLLRVLQERVYEPVGSTVSKRLHARILAATNRDLEQEVRSGRFRADLYYRLNVLKILLPPLRERLEDIPLLVAEFVDHYNRAMDRQVLGVSDEAMEALLAYRWPGNVRELENAIERAFVVCQGPVLELEHLPEEVRGGAARTNSDPWPAIQPQREEVPAGAGPTQHESRAGQTRQEVPAGADRTPPLAATRETRRETRRETGPAPGPDLKSQAERAELEALLWALERTHGNKAEAAKLLGIHKSTLYRKLKKFGLNERGRGS